MARKTNEPPEHMSAPVELPPIKLEPIHPLHGSTGQSHPRKSIHLNIPRCAHCRARVPRYRSADGLMVHVNPGDTETVTACDDPDFKSTDKTPDSKRAQIKAESVRMAMDMLQGEMTKRLRQKGDGTFASRHEILGCLTEEYLEICNAVQCEDNQHLVAELLDAAVACVFGAACIVQGGTEW